MKPISIVLIIFLFTINLIQAQVYQKAIVTDVNYMVRTGAIVNTSTFPFYFHYPEFVKDVHIDITKHVKERFGVDTLLFLLPDSIDYYENWVAKKTIAKKQGSLFAENEAIYISVETLIQESAMINGVYILKFTTRVKAYKKGGKKVYSFINHIPFEVWTDEEEIYGDAQMKEEDFYAFYFDGLKLAFEGKEKKIDKRYIQQVPTTYYKSFFSEAKKFYLKSQDFEYSYGPGRDELKPVFSFNYSRLRVYVQIHDWKRVDGNTFSEIGFKIYNKFKHVDYNLYYEKEVKKDSNYYAIQINFLDSARNVVSELYVDYEYILEGKISDREYKVNWNGNYGVTEIRAKGEMIALIRILDDLRIIWIKDSTTEEQLGDIFELIFAYDFANQIISE